MKAEHRKELETNILADKVGKFISGAKEGPSRGFVFYLLAGLAVLVVVFFVYRWFVYGSGREAAQWLKIEDGERNLMASVYETGIADYPGKVARFEFAWEDLWIRGIKTLGGNPTLALDSIKEAERKYTELAKACAGDPVFQPEALYGLAVIEETRLIDKENRNSIALVLEKYKDVVKANKDSAFGQLAKQRIADLEDDTKSRDVLRFYMEMEDKLKGLARPNLPQNIDLESLLKKNKDG